MATKQLRRLAIPTEVVVRLKRHGIYTCKDFLSKNLFELMKATGITRRKLQELVEEVSRAALPEHTTALRLLQQEAGPSFFPTTLPALDTLLLGGLPHGTITEIAGPPGCGKTQFCIMFSVLTTLPSSMGAANGSVAYIDTESAFSAERLVEIARCRFPDRFNSDVNLRDLCDRVHIYQEATCQELQDRLGVIEEDIIRHDFKLIVVDSIASLVRKEFDSRLQGNMIERTNLLAKQAATLKYIAESFKIPVVVTNQITTRLGTHPTTSGGLDDSTGDTSMEMGERSYVMAALGNTWGHSVNTRLVLQYGWGKERELIIAKSPVAPAARMFYSIESKGIVMKEGRELGQVNPGQQKISVRSPNDVMLPP